MFVLLVPESKIIHIYFSIIFQYYLGALIVQVLI